MDIDCVPGGAEDNLHRVSEALKELGARLRVGGMSDEEAKQLPVLLDAATLQAFGNSTWMTDAGPIDLLRELRDASGADASFDELRSRSVDYEIAGIVVHVADIADIIAAKQHANRAKDHEALPELRRIRDGDQRGS